MNLTDTPFYVKDGQATGGYNYDYVRTGGIQKIRGLAAVNSAADAELISIGLGTHFPLTGNKTVLRAAGTRVQTVDMSSGTFTNLENDIATPVTAILAAGSTQPVLFQGFSTASLDMTWLAGGGLTLPYGFNGTKLTENGVAAPTGTFTAVNQGSGTSGAWGTATGVYYYSIALRKTSTQALSNAALDQAVTIVTATDSVLVTFPTGVDATLYDKWYLYRSSVGGASAFTAGSIVALVDVGTASYIDLNVTFLSAQVVPRSGSVSLDNSQLPAGTYNSITLWKRRLVAAYGNTVCISDTDKSESWPTGLRINLPSAGPITGLSTCGYFSAEGLSDEYLVVYKERETWVITGTTLYNTDSDLYDLELKFVDSVGCITQSLAVRAGGYLCWIDYRGVYMWNGQGKPIYCSRPIESMFSMDGSINKSAMSTCWGAYSRRKNQVMWAVSDRAMGQNKTVLKLDLRLSSPRSADGIVAGVVVSEGVFMQDSHGTALYAGTTYLPGDNEEVILVGDDAGFVHQAYYGATNNGSGIAFSYQTKAFDFGEPTVAKQYSKVVAYIDKSVHADLTLDYWAGYRTSNALRSTVNTDMAVGGNITGAIWDLATWDVAYWDEGDTNSIVPVVFNLNSDQNNNSGDSLMLRFSQNGASVPVTIHGFTVFWDVLAPRK